jgi:hypothetical protein
MKALSFVGVHTSSIWVTHNDYAKKSHFTPRKMSQNTMSDSLKNSNFQ